MSEPTYGLTEQGRMVAAIWEHHLEWEALVERMIQHVPPSAKLIHEEHARLVNKKEITW